MYKLISGILLFALTSISMAETLPFELKISSPHLDVSKSLNLSDVGEGKTKINFDFKDAVGKSYAFELNYKALADNRSYPANLDITLKDGAGNKLGYLFWANNGVSSLKKTGTFGLIVDVEGEPVAVNFDFDPGKKGSLRVAQLEEERFVQDTLVPKFNFQMIRPVLVPMVSDGLRSQSYKLDAHPYAVNYTLKDLDDGLVQFQFNLYATTDGKNRLLERVYYNASSLDALREGMFAGKYFDKSAGTFKLVFYPTMGQTSPN